jgi:hypothetical protein
LPPMRPGSAASVSTCQTPPGKEMSLDVGWRTHKIKVKLSQIHADIHDHI